MFQILLHNTLSYRSVNMIQLKLFLFLCFVTFSYSELTKPIDLTWNFENDTLYWRGVQPFIFTKEFTKHQDGWFYSVNEFCAGEHGGTHLDAPYHFAENGVKVGQIPFETLIVPGKIFRNFIRK